MYIQSRTTCLPKISADQLKRIITHKCFVSPAEPYSVSCATRSSPPMATSASFECITIVLRQAFAEILGAPTYRQERSTDSQPVTTAMEKARDSSQRSVGTMSSRSCQSGRNVPFTSRLCYHALKHQIRILKSAVPYNNRTRR